MKRVFALLTLVLLAASPASAGDNMSKAEIARLPQDKVQVIKEACAREWDDDFRMRIYCEDRQYRALQALIERNS